MTHDELTKAFEAYVDAKSRHDLDAIVDLCTEDSFYESAGVGAPPTVGKEALREYYDAFFASLPDYHAEFDGVAYGEDTAVVWGHFGGTTTDSLLGMPVEPGRELRVPVTFVCTFRDGLLAGDRGYFDLVTICRQSGIPLDVLAGRTRPATSAAA
jgi:steroid delta-isomerase-like uncharacterized protein